MKHRFQKGQPKPEKAGRRAGTPNKSSWPIFPRDSGGDPAFQEKWRGYLLDTPTHLHSPSPHIVCGLLEGPTAGPVRERRSDMGTVTPEMQHFLQACAILVDEMSPQDFSEQECSLLAYYSLELYSNTVVARTRLRPSTASESFRLSLTPVLS